MQFCANDPDTLLAAAKYVEGRCDAVDINLGCPQGIARKGHYGSFLLEEWELLERMVNILHQNLSIPVTCKIRILPDAERTLELARRLQAAGCSLLCVHGRTKEMIKDRLGSSRMRRGYHFRTSPHHHLFLLFIIIFSLFYISDQAQMTLTLSGESRRSSRSPSYLMVSLDCVFHLT